VGKLESRRTLLVSLTLASTWGLSTQMRLLGLTHQVQLGLAFFCYSNRTLHLKLKICMIIAPPPSLKGFPSLLQVILVRNYNLFAKVKTNLNLSVVSPNIICRVSFHDFSQSLACRDHQCKINDFPESLYSEGVS